MKRTLALLIVVTSVLIAACSRSSGVNADAALSPPDDAPASTNPDDVTARSASAICRALFRCCDDDVVEYFAPYRGNELLAAFRERLPPAATLDEASCRDVLKPMLDIVPFGDWVRLAKAGAVTFDAQAFDACIAALDTASCGAEVREALWDSTCLGFAPPAGGPTQRSFMTRTRGPSATCEPIRDGIGAAFYGSCDPTQAFCCYQVAGRDGCQYPFDANGEPRNGTCQAVAGTGMTCSPTAPVALCATGIDCDSDTLTCVAPQHANLPVGATCIDAGYHVLGTCVDSFCDVLGTRRCEARHGQGHACSGDEECASGRCKQVCVDMDLCTGMPGGSGGGGVDAGIDAAVDAAVDAAPASSGETCGSAHDLVATSGPSPKPGYQRVTAAFGAQNDYNPLVSSQLPPHCSVVYDARGRELVYAITLDPGERLQLQVELADGKQAGIYLLDSCPAATWPDFDGSGACGSNEYKVGHCGIIGCDPAVLDILYPAMTGTQPNPTRTFWLVIDQVGGDTSTGFTLDWRVQ